MEALAAHFAEKGIHFNPSWLSALLQHRSLQASRTLDDDEDRDHDKQLIARHFLISSIRNSLRPPPPHRLPTDLVSIQNDILMGPVVLQIVQIREIGMSLGMQLDRLDAYEEKMKPLARRVIRKVDEDDDDEDLRTSTGTGTDTNTSMMMSTSMGIGMIGGNAGPSHGDEGSDEQACDEDKDRGKGMIGKKMCRVLLEDAAGTRVYGIEGKAVDPFYVGMELGAKIMVQGTPILEGVLFLKPARTIWMGGKIEPWNRNNDAKGLRQALVEEIARQRQGLR